MGLALTQNDVETVIKKPTPLPESEDESESFEREGDCSIALHERNSFEEIDGLEKTASNICPQFPINYVSKPKEITPLTSEKDIDGNVSINNLQQINESKNNFIIYRLPEAKNEFNS